MNWDAIGATAEFLGAIGVIVTLFYLASQLRRNSRALEAATNQAVSDATQERLLAPAQNVALAAAFSKSRIGEALSPTEETQLAFFSRATFRGIQNIFFQHRKGLISDEVWRDYEQVLMGQSTASHTKEWWRRERPTFDRDFVRAYESLISSAKTD
ncbi:MAG: hypothetical protein PVH91_00340 [Pseudomonadales bacterium]|jgi:hypothetical protein